MGSEKESARHWYVVHTYSGYENKVLESLKQKVQSMGLENEIFDVIIPEKGVDKTKVVHDIDVEVGETVKICSGPFENFAAKVVSVDDEKGKIKALVDMFGRETNVELDFDQVEKN